MNDDNEESLLEFPCEFPIKIMGINQNNFIDYVCDLIRPFFPGLTQEHVKIRESRHAKYVSVTVTVLAECRKQLDDIYQTLSDSERVKMAL